MTKKLTMRLLVDGIEKEKIEAYTEISDVSFMRDIFGDVEITGEDSIKHFSKEITDTEGAYHFLEKIHNTKYPYKKVKIEMEYN